MKKLQETVVSLAKKRMECWSHGADFPLDSETANFVGTMLRETLLEAAAEVGHEMRNTYCAELLGDFGRPTWEELTPESRQRKIEEVQFILFSSTTVMPAEVHSRWRRGKEAEGWGYGLDKHEEAKLHPGLTDYDRLPMEFRIKYTVFVVAVWTTARFWKETFAAFDG